MKNQLKGTISLLACTVIWGSAFVAQSVGMNYIGPFTFQTIRSVLAIAALMPLIWLMDRQQKSHCTFFENWHDPQLWKAGFYCGISLFIASNLQQIGIIYTEPGKAGFITAMYIILVPVFSIFLREKPPKKVWISIILATFGLYLLSYTGGIGQINTGDFLIFMGAVCFAIQILIIDRMGKHVDGVRLNCIQFMIAAALSGIVMFFREAPRMQDIRACAFPLFYAGVMSSAIAYSLQIIGQQHVSSAKASLILSMESVFAALSGWIILNQVMTFKELLGCAFVLSGVILSQYETPQAQKSPV